MRRILILLLTTCFIFTAYMELIPECKINAEQFVYEVKQYQPKKGLEFVYRGGEGYAGCSLSVELIGKDRVVVRQKGGEKDIIKVYRNADDEITLIYTEEYNNQSKDYINIEPNRKEVILKTPIAEGTSWTNDDGKEFIISKVNKRIITPCGVYDTIEVTSKWSSFEYKCYYAVGVGLVKTIERNRNNYSTVSELSKVIKK